MIGLCQKYYTSRVEITLTQIGRKQKGLITEIVICEKCKEPN